MRFTPIALLALCLPAIAADVPTPKSQLGFRPGDDFRLVSWPQVVDYFGAVDKASDRVTVRELGKTTEGRPYLVAAVSSPDTIAHLDRYKALQRRIADPRTLDEGSEAGVIDESKAVVLITCSIHSSETASTLMALELLHDLATGDDPETREVLDKTILLLVPSANPDGVDKVATWYERTKGKPWEGGGMPELYHKYAGHDTNRDWFMLNLQETRLLTRLLYHDWFPTLTYDVHQMGSTGARLFVPPFFDPINPNLDPRIHQSIALIGSHMAADLASKGKKGVLTHAMYDNWWNGGNRTTPQRHNMVGVLTEAASVKLASPIFLEKDQLKGATRGFSDHRPAINFVEPWPGGWWRLRDIIDYELISARSLLTLAARYKSRFQRDYVHMGRDAVAKGKSEPPFAWVVPADQADPGRATEMVRILNETGIEVRRAREKFVSNGLTVPAGSWILRADQPYRSHLKDMMERQVYPARFSANGSAEPPYDVAGWTLPLQMGVSARAVNEPFQADDEVVRDMPAMKGKIEGVADPKGYVVENRSNDDFLLLNALLKEGIEVRVLEQEVKEERQFSAESYWFADTPAARGVLNKTLPSASARAIGTAFVAPETNRSDRPTRRLTARRIGLYQPWSPSMDEGWTRLVLERYGFPYTTLHNADLQAGDLKNRIDTLILPSISAKSLREGWKADESEPAYVGGIGNDGSEAIRAFINSGGTLVCLEASSEYAIEELKLPIKNVLKGLPTSKFYGPGSIVRIQIVDDTMESHGSWRRFEFGTWGLISAYFDRSLAFDVVEKGKAVVLARYAVSSVLESGWLLGPENLEGKAALVSVPHGLGRVILFAFPPQHRGQTQGTFRLFFNTLIGD